MTDRDSLESRRNKKKGSANWILRSGDSGLKTGQKRDEKLGDYCSGKRNEPRLIQGTIEHGDFPPSLESNQMAPAPAMASPIPALSRDPASASNRKLNPAARARRTRGPKNRATDSTTAGRGAAEPGNGGTGGLPRGSNSIRRRGWGVRVGSEETESPRGRENREISGDLCEAEKEDGRVRSLHNISGS